MSTTLPQPSQTTTSLICSGIPAGGSSIRVPSLHEQGAGRIEPAFTASQTSAQLMLSASCASSVRPCCRAWSAPGLIRVRFVGRFRRGRTLASWFVVVFVCVSRAILPQLVAVGAVSRIRQAIRPANEPVAALGTRPNVGWIVVHSRVCALGVTRPLPREGGAHQRALPVTGGCVSGRYSRVFTHAGFPTIVLRLFERSSVPYRPCGRFRARISAVRAFRLRTSA